MSLTGKWPTTTECHLMIKLINYSTFNNMDKQNKTKRVRYICIATKAGNLPESENTLQEHAWTNGGWKYKATFMSHNLGLNTVMLLHPYFLFSFLLHFVRLRTGHRANTCNSSTWNLEFKAIWALQRMLQKQTKTC